jgi:tetratricopeptide (TPR) repeat protein
MLAGIAAITVLAYYPGMSAGFYFDDEPNVIRVDAMRWTEFNVETLRRTLTEVANPTRPVANISLGTNHLFSGPDATPYHWTNLVIHLVVGLSLFWVIRLFQRYHVSEQGGEWLALSAVLLFLVHPLNIQAVTYVVQRMTSMAALFFLLGLGCYLTGRYRKVVRKRLAWFALTALCLLLSIGSKEIGYLLLPLILLYEICFHHSDWRDRFLTGTTSRGRVILVSVSILTALLAGSFAWYLLDGRIYWLDTMPGRDFSGYERVLTQARVQILYLSLLLWPTPSRLNIDHDFLISRGLFDPATTAMAMAFWLIVLVFAVRHLSSRPRLAFPVLAYLLLHSMESAPISLELVFEHRMYLPMAFLLLFIPLNLGPIAGAQRIPSFAALSAVGVLLASATYQRNAVWGDPLDFFRDSATKSPAKFRPVYNLGSELGRRGMSPQAKTVLEKAVRLKPDHSEAHNQLANVYMLEKQPTEAERHYRLAIQHNPKNAEALFNLAKLLESQDRQKEQLQILKQFVLYAPPYLEQQKRWATYYLKIHDG